MRGMMLTSSKMTLILLASFILGLTVLAPLAPLAHAQVVTATVTVGSAPDGVAYDSGKGEVFVANEGPPGTVSVIFDSTNTVLTTVAVGTGPFGVAYDSGKGEVFVSNLLSGTVSVISDTQPTTTATTATTFMPVHQTPVGGVMLPSVGLTVLLPWAIALSLLGVLSVVAVSFKQNAKRR